ncbi:MDR family MFS transporter [Ornithinimicrobium tianjinense]|uniref:MFS transporter n=1 Tax=Ornithinimicrobium tianjinense TaxID=1195761 RepID=A0A917F9P6_9MICO|nr:MDR family MFS transporter [Ornithinimicrobium tianjinense]GGF60236.1 MFS transporter [Ornithinimicrobium tianjinense]
MAPYRMSKEHQRVFVGLMLGMLVASISQTIVGPGLPRIVAELGGMEHYSWVATAAMLVSAVAVPIVGKLSDLYGRKSFYVGGIVVFMLGSVISGLAPNFWTLVAGRAVQGLGMGTLMPLSQTIIGDIVPPRARGKYQGLMGAIFGLTSVAGPLAGGVITDHLGWRWLFFAALPFGLATLFFIVRFLHLPHTRREAKIDVAGIVTLTIALVAILLATSWGGTTYAWSSPTILGLYAVGAVFVALFVRAELRAAEPVLPLRLFRSPVISWASVAAFGLAMVMFGAIIYIPVYAQGVLGVDATNSGLILMPMMVSFVVVGILAGLLVTRTGRYKPFMLAGVVVMGAGLWLLTQLEVDSSQGDMTVAMAVLGLGLGLCMQLYTLVVQNVVGPADMGVATASTQFFRNVGSTVGIAIFGTVMTSGLGAAIMGHLPPEAAAKAGGALSHADAGSALDPAAMEGMPPVVLAAVRAGLADRLHEVFLLGLPILAVVLVATALIPHVPLRETVHTREDAERELLDAMGDAGR